MLAWGTQVECGKFIVYSIDQKGLIMSDSRYQKLNESDEIDLVELVKICGRKNYGLFYLPSFVPPLRQAMLLQLKSNGHRQRSLQLLVLLN